MENLGAVVIGSERSSADAGRVEALIVSEAAATRALLGTIGTAGTSHKGEQFLKSA